jgi:RNA polymerase sigma factor (sigma-70 family)
MLSLGIMRDLERQTLEVIDRFAVVIRKVVQGHLHPSDILDPQDIEQEIRIKIWTFLKKGKRVDNLSSYIKRVAYSTTIDELRKMKRMKPPLALTAFDAEGQLLESRIEGRGDEDPGTLCETRAMRRVLLRAVDTLSENRRRILKLYLGGMSVEEISDHVHWDRSKVRHLLYRGIDEIRSKIRPRRVPVASLSRREGPTP